MQTKHNTIFVLMPDNSRLEVSYYCKQTAAKQKETELIIQLHDCICRLKIDESICNSPNELEHLVHKKVLNTRGHLCE